MVIVCFVFIVCTFIIGTFYYTRGHAFTVQRVRHECLVFNVMCVFVIVVFESHHEKGKKVATLHAQKEWEKKNIKTVVISMVACVKEEEEVHLRRIETCFIDVRGEKDKGGWRVCQSSFF